MRLTDHNILTDVGEVGELLIEGDILARGYLNAPTEAAAAFVTGVTWAGSGLDSGHSRRFYKTGDLARLEPDGTISCLGRRDKQIKIRGQRVELGDIESHIKQCLGGKTQNSVVELIKMNSIEHLVSFIILGSSYDAVSTPNTWRKLCSELRVHLSNNLPSYMIPSEFIPIRDLPVNVSGKLDRAALVEAFKTVRLRIETPPETGDERNNGLENGTELEQFKIEVAQVLSLSTQAADLSQSFLQLGGNSLLAIKLISRLRMVDMHLSIQDILQRTSLLELAQKARLATVRKTIRADAKKHQVQSSTIPVYPSETEDWVASRCGVETRFIESLHPCTPFQATLIPALTRQPCTYVAQYVFKVPKDVNLNRFKKCWEIVYQEFPIFRSRFVVSPTHGALRVVVRGFINWNQELGLDPSKGHRMMESLGAGTQLSVFSLAPCDDGYRFILIVHHLLFDEWSLQLCLDHVAQLYEGSRLPSTIPSFDRFVNFSINSTKSDLSRSFWSQQLDSTNVTQFPSLPSLTYRPTLNARHRIQIQPLTSDKARTSILLRASLALTIGISTGQSEICFGTVMSGRDADLPGIDEVVGPTLATVPVRIVWNSDQTVSQFLETIDTQQRNTTPHEHFGLQEIRKTCAGALDACNFQTMLLIQAASPRGKTDRLFGDREETEIRDSHAFVIECHMEVDGLTFDARFDSKVVSTQQCERFLNTWEHMLHQLSGSDGNKTLASLGNVSRSDMQTLTSWNQRLPLPSPGLVHEHLEGWSKREPDRMAVESWDGNLTFRQLDMLSSNLAESLGDSDLAKIVPLYFPKGLTLIVALWAVLKSGRAFLCLDTETPVDRLLQILEQLGRPMFLAHDANLPEALVHLRHRTIDRVDPTQLDRTPPHKPYKSHVSAHDAAYMIMTSGSTGVPKGALIEHQALMTSLTHNGPAWGIRESSRMLQFSSIGFDAAVMEMLAIAVLGACLCVPEQRIDLDALNQFMEAKKANWAFLTPSFLRIVKPYQMPSLETVAAGGEAMDIEVAKTWGPAVNLINIYGPCECTLSCAARLVRGDGLNVSSIGKAVACVLWVVDADNHERLVPVGSVGELLIEGPIVGRGYVNDGENTSAKFISPPSWTKEFPRKFSRMYKTGDLVRHDDDGSFIYVGRKDNQVKLRGQRMELGEVEHNIQSAASSPHVLCFVPKKGIFAHRLVAVLGARHGNLLPASAYRPKPLELDDASLISIQEIRAYVEKKLPRYMVPEHFAILQDMPVSMNGKLDRRKMGSWIEDLTSEDGHEFSTGAEMQAGKADSLPVTESETVMQNIWAAVIGLPHETVAMNRSFQALGGDSITAMQAIARARNKGFSITIRDLLGGDDIRTLSRKSKNNDDLVPKESRSEIRQLTPLSAIQVAYSLLAPVEEAHHFNQSVQVLPRRSLSLQDLERAMRAITIRHPQLRSRYEFSSRNKPTQRIREEPEGSFSLGSTHASNNRSISEHMKEVQKRPNPIAGPIIHCELLHIEGCQQRLILVAHHLAVDIVSWKLILEDLEAVLEGAELRPTPQVSYQIWCESVMLQHSPEPHFPKPPQDYWSHNLGPLTYGDVARESLSLDGPTTALCMGQSNKCLQTKPTDLIIAAISSAFRSTFPGRDHPVVCLEGHGRQRLGIDLDVSNVVGWFTAVTPVYVPVIDGESLVQFCRRIKDARFDSENTGLDFFGAQDLSHQNTIDIPEIMVNFTGVQRTGTDTGGLLQDDPDSLGDQYDFSVNMHRFSMFDFAISVTNGELKFELLYNPSILHADRAKQWLFACKSILQEICTRLATSQAMLTLSSYPDLIHCYDDLDRLGSNLQQVQIGLVQEQAAPWAEFIFPATPMQGQMLRAQKRNPKYWCPALIYKISTSGASVLDLKNLAAAWERVVALNPILRTVLLPDPHEPSTGFVNVVLGGVSLSDCITVSSSTDLADLPRTEWKLNTPQHHLTIAQHDLTSALCRLEVNHALMDHASLVVVQECLSQAYENQSVALDVVPYQQYAAALAKVPSAAGIDFWATYLRGVRPCLVASTLAPDSLEDRSLCSVQIDINQISQSMSAVCKAHEITAATILRLAWALVLREHVKCDDVVFGFVVSGRDAPIADLDRVVGPVMNIIGCRVVNTEQGTLEILKTIQGDYYTASEHQHHLATYLSRKSLDSVPGLFDTVINVRQHNKIMSESANLLVLDHQPGSEDPFEVS